MTAMRGVAAKFTVFGSKFTVRWPLKFNVQGSKFKGTSSVSANFEP
jgi:hypothetical protein